MIDEAGVVSTDTHNNKPITAKDAENEDLSAVIDEAAKQKEKALDGFDKEAVQDEILHGKKEQTTDEAEQKTSGAGKFIAGAVFVAGVCVVGFAAIKWLKRRKTSDNQLEVSENGAS